MKKVIIIILLLVASIALAVKVSPTLESFNGGQVSPFMETRISFPKYRSSCRTIENMLVTVHGPAERRPGTKFISEVFSSGQYGFGAYGEGIYGE